MNPSKDQLYCVLDYETYSEAPLKKTGAFEYSVHPSTEILCVAWRLGTRETLPKVKTKTWTPSEGPNRNSFELLHALINPKILLVAHNALFEQVITRNVLPRSWRPDVYPELKELPSSRWICTASLAAALALPRKLEGAAAALGLKVQKDKEGHKLILKWCKPKRPSKKDPSTRHSDPKELQRIIEYCATDVDAEVELFLRSPPLPEKERKIWELDQKINLRGFQVDRPLVKSILDMLEIEKHVLDSEVRDLTFDELYSASQRDGVLEWLKAEGVDLKNLQSKNLSDTIESGLVDGYSKRMMELRLAISRTSTAKYQAFELRSRHNGRVRDILLYWGASTGRWAGTGINPQNFPRGSIKNTIQASEILSTKDLELTRLIYGDPMSVFSSCLRNMIVAPKGKILDVADYAAIETRVLFWLAKHERGLKAFNDGRDLYIEQASSIFGIPASKIGKDSFERFVGKGVILGCGYAMGGKKFAKTCENQGQPIGEELATIAVKTYRSTHSPIPALWRKFEIAAAAAVLNPGKRYTLNRTTWFVRNHFLWCQLPSGRHLAYYGPTVKHEPTPWKEIRPVLYHYSSNPITKQWENSKTYGGKLVENVVQAIARDLMAEAMLRIENRGPWEIVLSVHDELIAERNLKLGGSNSDFCDLMAELPAWADGCPVKVEGWEGKRYKK